MPDLLKLHPSGKHHLPNPRGLHSVGYIDIMTDGDPNTGTFLRLYYPCVEEHQELHNRWPLWVPEDKYISGIITFLKSMADHWPSWAANKEYKFFGTMRPMMKNAPRSIAKSILRNQIGNVYIPIIDNASIKEAKDGSKWPIVVFSHGIGCSRFMYSQVCYDIASNGFIVAATEHRDGSGCMSQYYDTSYITGINTSTYSNRWVYHSRCPQSGSGNLVQDEYIFRNKQIHQRSKEVSRTLDILLDLNDGKDIGNIFQKYKTSQADSGNVNLHQFENKMDVSNPVIAGQSFGGATTILALIEDERFKIGVAQDAWLFPLKDEDISVNYTIPILCINTESFLSPENLGKMSQLKTDDENGAERKFCYIKGSVHQNQLDLPFVLRNKTMKKMFGSHSETHPEKVMSLNNKLTIQFIEKKLGRKPNLEINDEIAKLADLVHPGLGIDD